MILGKDSFAEKGSGYKPVRLFICVVWEHIHFVFVVTYFGVENTTLTLTANKNVPTCLKVVRFAHSIFLAYLDVCKNVQKSSLFWIILPIPALAVSK